MKALVFAPRTVVGYHGCTATTAQNILTEGQFRSSVNQYDWLGYGVYFWEYAPYRVWEWAGFVASLKNDEPAVLRATIRLGFCVNLLDTRDIPGLIGVYTRLAQISADIPVNTLRGAHYLDRFVVDAYAEFYQKQYQRTVQTVRGCFPEGAPIYNGSRILSKAHVQVAVRDLSCITSLELVFYSQEQNIAKK